jgi:hypothetical protein
MKRLALLLLTTLAAAACVEEPTNRGGEVIPVFWIDARLDTAEQGSFDRIDEACGFWALTCADSDDPFDSIMLVLTDQGGPASDDTHKLGFASYDPCNPILWAADVDLALEHEIGHAFTLEHVPEMENVMFKSVSEGGDYVSFAQRVTVEDEAADRCD